MGKRDEMERARVRAERAAVSAVLDTFDGEILFRQKVEPERTSGQRIRDRLAFEEALRAEAPRAPVPFWGRAQGDRAGRVAVIHRSPAPTDFVTGEIGGGEFAGRLRGELRSLGFNPVEVTEIAASWIENGSPPTVYDLDLARPLMMRALDAADVDCVLLHGWHALHVWRPDLTLLQAAGIIGLWDSRWWVMAIHHVESTSAKFASVQPGEWRRHLARFAEMVRAPDRYSMISGRCIANGKSGRCVDGVHTWDDDGLPWCRKHYETALDKLRKARARVHQGAEPDQLTLEGL